MAVKLTKTSYGEKPETRFVNNLYAIKVRLTDSQAFARLLSYLPDFVRATYSESPNAQFSDIERLAIVRDVFMGRSLPTSQETIGLTFVIDGIDLTTVTHLIRHRQGSYSADCSAEKWWHKKDALVPSSIGNSPELYERYQKIIRESKQLYCDMIDTGDISIMDARFILPRCLSTYYFAHFPLNAAIAFIKQRVDRQIQPESDNIIAYQMYIELLKAYPLANGLINIDAQDKLYLLLKEKQGPMFKPEPKNDVWEHNDEDFLYPKLRSEMKGTGPRKSEFDTLYKFYSDEIKEIEWYNSEWLKKNYGITFEELDKLEVPLR